jgi:WD40 repeat protein
MAFGLSSLQSAVAPNKFELDRDALSFLEISRTYDDHTHDINGLSFSSFGKFLVTTGDDHLLNLYSLERG